MRTIAVACGLLAPALLQAQSFSIVTPPTLPSGSLSQGSSYTTQLTLRDDGPSYFYSVDVLSFDDAVVKWMTTGFLPSYLYDFQIVNDATGTDDGLLSVSGSTDMTGVSGAYLFVTGMTHSWKLSFSGKTGGPYGSNHYTAYIRAFDTNCSLRQFGKINDPRCIVYKLALASSTVNWLAPALPPAPAPTPAPAPAPPSYPIVNHRPGNMNPPTTFPTSSFLTCTVSGCQ